MDLDLRKTLLIEEIPRYLCKKGELRDYFAKAFDGRQEIPCSQIPQKIFLEIFLNIQTG